jgi:hypothetical protein
LRSRKPRHSFTNKPIDRTVLESTLGIFVCMCLMGLSFAVGRLLQGGSIISSAWLTTPWSLADIHICTLWASSIISLAWFWWYTLVTLGRIPSTKEGYNSHAFCVAAICFPCVCMLIVRAIGNVDAT